MNQEGNNVEYFDSPEMVDRCFKAQRKLSFTYGAVFFAIVLLIPLLSSTSEWWYGKEIWGGFTLNYLVVALFFHVIYFFLGLSYARKANRLEDELIEIAGNEVAGS